MSLIAFGMCPALSPMPHLCLPWIERLSPSLGGLWELRFSDFSLSPHSCWPTSPRAHGESHLETRTSLQLIHLTHFWLQHHQGLGTGTRFEQMPLNTHNTIFIVIIIFEHLLYARCITQMSFNSYNNYQSCSTIYILWTRKPILKSLGDLPIVIQ